MTKALAGIQGVLGNYLTPGEAPQPSPSINKRSDQAIANRNARKAEPPRRSVARRGRPPGKSETKTSPKEKATLRIDAALMSDYRDWSWEDRCQLGELVERALVEYRTRHR